MSKVHALQTPGASRRGRPAKAAVDPSTLEVLGIPEVLAFCRAKGRKVSREALKLAIARKELPAVEDLLCRDKRGQPLLKVRRMELEAWLGATLRPVFTLSLNEKGPLPRAL